MALDTIQNREWGSALHSGLETGAQIGLSLAASALAGLPFNTTKWKLLATGIGGGIPMLFKSVSQVFGAETGKEARNEALFNVAELGAGIAVGFLPSFRIMLAAGAGLSFGFEFLRQTVVHDRGWKDALASAATAAGFSSLIGGAFHGVTQLRWNRVEKGIPMKEFGDNLDERTLEEATRINSAIASMARGTRRYAPAPTIHWYQQEEARKLRALAEEIRAIKIALKEKRLTAEAVLGFYQSLEQMLFNTQVPGKIRRLYFDIPKYGDEIVIRESAFLHELRNELSGPLLSLELLARQIEHGKNIDESIRRMTKKLEKLDLTLAFFREKTDLPEAFSLLEKRFTHEGHTVKVTIEDPLSHLKERTSDAALIAR
ncbi:MAG: hypothetical protein Q7S68_01615, partial [Deltaproteobacteria bacterium]|nr:hypothetical protein [Deltaproteobacteria bacterium]